MEALPYLDVDLILERALERSGLEKMLDSVSIVRGLRTFSSAVEAMQTFADEGGPADIAIFGIREIRDFDTGVLARDPLPSTKLLVLLDSSADPVEALWTTGARADGFLHGPELSVAALDEALRRAHAGEVPIPPGLTRSLLGRIGTGDAPVDGRNRPPPVRMTPREQQALELLVEGMSNKQIARRLGISGHGAKRLVANIMAKLNSPNRTSAVARALQEGMFKPEAEDEV